LASAVLTRGGNPPEPPAMQLSLLAARQAASLASAVLTRGGNPPEPPAMQLSLLAARQAASLASAVLTRGSDPPEPPGNRKILGYTTPSLSMMRAVSALLLTCLDAGPTTPWPRRSPCCGTWITAVPKA